MRKYRWLAGLFGLAMLGVSLCGCHGSLTKEQKESAEEYILPETFDTTKPYEITFWAKNDTNKKQVAVYQKAVEQFQQLYPNVTVNVKFYTDYSRIYNDVITNISTNTTPNICITYPDNVATYLTGTDVVVPLDQLMSDERYGMGGSELRFDSVGQDEIIPEFLAECKLGEHYYALPYMRSTEACYINKTYVEELGYELPDVLTWDFVWEVAEAATKKNAEGIYDINGQNIMIPFLYKSTDNMMIQSLYQLGADYCTKEGEVLLFNDATTNILKTVAAHTKTGAFSTFAISSYPANFLNAGQCIFAVDSTAGATWMGPKAPLIDIAKENLVDFEVAVRPIPQYDPEHPLMISQGPSMCLFYKEDPGEVLASWLFMQFLLTNETQNAYAMTEGYVPVTRTAQDSEAYQEYLSLAGTDNNEHYEVKIAATRLLIEHASDTFVSPAFNGSASVRSAATHIVEDVTKATRRKKTVDDAYIQALYADTTSLYRLDQLNTSGLSTGALKELGEIPQTSIILLVVLGVVWVGIAGFFLMGRWKEKHQAK